ncbi:MAG: hypothetical protein SPL72_01465 [Cyanobacteriota bacterium]|nr:hypothetical protein [Cyanobacteriota bacterium]
MNITGILKTGLNGCKKIIKFKNAAFKNNAAISSFAQDPINFKKVDLSAYTKDMADIKINKMQNISSTEILKKQNFLNADIKKCVTALQGDNPREYAILADEKTGKVVTEGMGSITRCRLFLKNFDYPVKKKKLSIFHGHIPIITKAGKMTLPVSLQDFIVLNDSPVRKIVSFDAKGRSAVLEKMEDFKKLTPEDLSDLKSYYMKELLNQSPKDKTDGIKKLYEYSKTHPQDLAVKREITNEINRLQYQEGADKIIDGFWKKYSQDYRLRYNCDYVQ